MKARTLSDLTGPVTALIALEARFPHLPAPCVRVTTVFPDLLELSFHYDDFAAFETWREALNIAPAEVEHHVQNDGATAVRSAAGTFAGATLRLVGFAPIPVLKPLSAGSGAGS
ncbi:hypothetical protein [Streptomyces sp. NPDC047974]|uniref:hypothetical protein n=1 Tax=Streptomyces sp. NPDC047974 TaxID=3154343 RepID=UPI0033C1161F